MQIIQQLPATYTLGSLSYSTFILSFFLRVRRSAGGMPGMPGGMPPGGEVIRLTEEENAAV